MIRGHLQNITLLKIDRSLNFHHTLEYLPYLKKNTSFTLRYKAMVYTFMALFKNKIDQIWELCNSLDSTQDTLLSTDTKGADMRQFPYYGSAVRRGSVVATFVPLS